MNASEPIGTIRALWRFPVRVSASIPSGRSRPPCKAEVVLARATQRRAPAERTRLTGHACLKHLGRRDGAEAGVAGGVIRHGD
jgi:hypothetical protein